MATSALKTKVKPKGKPKVGSKRKKPAVGGPGSSQKKPFNPVVSCVSKMLIGAVVFQSNPGHHVFQ